MGIGSRKRRGDRTSQEEALAFPSSPGLDDAQRDAIIARLFDGVLRSARSQLLRADSPLAAEVWGSGLMAVWEGLPAATGPNPFTPGGDTEASFIEALIRHAAELRSPDGMAVLCALAAARGFCPADGF